MMYEQQLVKMDTRRKQTRSVAKSEERLEILDLSGMSLEALPNPSLNLAAIHKLDLSNNNLQSIPEAIMARLLNVVILDLHSNQITTLPNSIGCLSKLKVLNISGNLLPSLPKTVVNCRSLEELNANFNKITLLPDDIGFELIKLKKLLVNSNKLNYLPYSTSHLTNLRILDAHLNCLRTLPEDLENLVDLQVLNISQNFQYLSVLPYSIGLLMGLIELDISYNNIVTLPDSIGCLKKLRKFNAEGNPLISPPMKVMNQGLDMVREYLSQKMVEKDQISAQNKSWIRKFVKCGTFNGGLSRYYDMEEIVTPTHKNMNDIASPRHNSMFSPSRVFSPKKYFRRSNSSTV